jgi:hypothetical protein
MNYSIIFFLLSYLLILQVKSENNKATFVIQVLPKNYEWNVEVKCDACTVNGKTYTKVKFYNIS